MRPARRFLAIALVLPGSSVSGGQSELCAPCHADIWRSYQRTGMARSFYRPAPEKMIENFGRGNMYRHEPSGIDYQMIHVRDARGDRYLQSQSGPGFDGKRTSALTNSIDFVMGSGNHARTYLHRTPRGTLQQLPLAWYAENGGYWAMSPGYDRADHQGFQRSVTYDCMFCHNAYPEIPADTGPRSPPVFTSLPEGIDCQRCHGDGAAHMALARKGSGSAEIRKAIVNPARLTGERQLDVCAQCHLETTSSPLPGSIVRYERAPFSYRPGEPLGDFQLHFDHSPGTGRDAKFEISSSVYRLRQSACFRKSKGALTCTTCHNPHEVLRGEQAARHYNTVCLQCHQTPHTRSTGCIECHMPKRRTEDAVHVAMTDHYIQRTKPTGDLLAPRAEQPVDAHPYRGEVIGYHLGPEAPRADDELYLAIAQVTQQSNLLQGIPRLRVALDRLQPERAEYYLQLGDALSSAGRPDEATAVYQEALRREPRSAPALERLALALAAQKRLAGAEAALNSALAIAPESAGTWILLGSLHAQQGKLREAVAALERATAIDPDLPDAWNTAGAIRFELGDVAQAEKALRRALLLQPNHAPARNNLGNLLSASGRFEQAALEFECALRIRPNYIGARYDYALALAKVRRPDDAEKQLLTILRTDPNSAAAHDFLGNILLAEGRSRDALAHYREAVRIVPDYDHANLELGKMLAASGDVAGARRCLEKAARSAEPAIGQEARKALAKLKPKA